MLSHKPETVSLALSKKVGLAVEVDVAVAIRQVQARDGYPDLVLCPPRLYLFDTPQLA
jgi:hypothetical protein